MRVRWTGTKAELMTALRALPKILAGGAPDPTGLVEGMQLRLGSKLLSHIKDAYELKSEGGTDAMGIQWPPLAPSTLGLRRKVTGAKTISKLQASLKELPTHRKRLIAAQRERLLNLYAPGAGAARQRRQALRFLRLMQPYLAPTRYKKLVSEIKEQKPEKAKQLALSGGFAQMLRDTGRLFNSLSPGTVGGDQVLHSVPGKVIVGSNVKTRNGINLLDLHDSGATRKKNKDGTDRLPRRQVLPDAEHPIPSEWWHDMVDAYASGLQSKAFWDRYLNPAVG